MNNELNRHIEERRGITMLVHLGHGIGMSLAINGMLAFHRNQHGGELGHNICDPDGEICRCGRRGCLETYLSVDNFLRHLQQKDHSRITPSLSEAIQRYRQHDKNCQELINESLHHLAIILANQINNLSPDYLVLNGSMLGFGRHFCKVLETKLRALLFDYSSQALTIVFREPEDENCTATGAALLARNHLLDSPEAFDKYCH